MEFVVSRDPCLHSHLLLPSFSPQALPSPVKGRATTYHFWARNALYHGLRVLGLKAGDTVLVPAFHCRTVVEPILHYGCGVVFYNVQRNGKVDLEDIARKIDRQTKAIIAIHYFGVLQPVHQLQAICKQHGLFFIEDCAHIFMGDIAGEPIGSFGEISIFSWRKFLPLYDGGLLVRNHVSGQGSDVKWESLSGWYQLKIFKNLIEQSWRDKSRGKRQGSFPLVNVSMTSEDCIEPREKNSQQTKPSAQKPEFDETQVNWPMSRWSKMILKKIDTTLVVQKRQENAQLLFDAIQSVPEIHPWLSEENANVCAWAFPIVVEHRDDVHVELRKKEIQAFTWEEVIHPLLPIEKFPDAKFLYEHLVLLPNQQSLKRIEIDLVVQCLKEVLSSPSSRESQVLK